MSFTREEFLECLSELGISQVEAAKLLSVTPRTLNRWAEKPHEISGPAEQAFRAWRRLQHYNLPWRPDGIHLAENDPILCDKIGHLRNYSIGLEDMLKLVPKYDGVNLPWQVDLKKRIARLETIIVDFNILKDGSFTPTTYRRTDQKPCTNCQLIEFAVIAIQKSIMLSQEK